MSFNLEGIVFPTFAMIILLLYRGSVLLLKRRLNPKRLNNSPIADVQNRSADRLGRHVHHFVVHMRGSLDAEHHQSAHDRNPIRVFVHQNVRMRYLFIIHTGNMNILPF